MAILSNINGLFAVEDNGAIKFNNLTGTDNQVLIANTDSSPTWVDVSTIIGGPYLELTGGTLAGDGDLVVGGTLTVNGVTTLNSALSGSSATFTGIITALGGTSTEWNTSYDNSITGLAVTGTTTKTLTATQQDGGTLTASWADNDSNTTWPNVGAGIRTNYTLGIKPPANGYAGFYFQTSTGTTEDAGYFLIRGSSDAGQVYKAEGITLVADAGWLSLVSRTTSTTGVRILSGSTSAERLVIKDDGDSYFTGELAVGMTSTPNAQLHVSANGSAAHSSSTGIDVAAGAGGGNVIALDAADNHNWFPYTNGDNYYSANNHLFRSGTGNSPYYMTINTSGNVGIGMGSSFSSVKLQVQGSNHFVTFVNPSTTANHYAQMLLKAGDRNNYIWTANQNSTNWGGAGSLNIYTAETGSSIAFFTEGDATNTKLMIEAGGNVGIGTNSPDLGAIAGTRVLTIASPTAERWGILELAGNRTWGGNQVGELKFISTDSTNNGTLVSLTAINDPSATGTGGSLKFSTRPNGGSLTEKMRITSDGMVGIGMTPNTAGASTYMLQLYNPGSQCFLSIGNGTSGNGPLNGLVIGNDASNAYIVNREATSLIFATSDANRMTILAGGNVGIGTTTPSVPLHVARASTGTTFRLQQTASNLYSEMQFSTPTGNMYIFVNSSGYTSYGGANSTNFYTSNGAFAFHSNAGNNHLYIANGGNIGIGTTSPTSAKLVVAGLVMINNTNAPNNLAQLNIGYTGVGETRAIDIDGGWNSGESKSITFTYGTAATNMVGQINCQYSGPSSKLRWGKLYHSGDSSTYTMELISSSQTTANLTVAGNITAAADVVAYSDERLKSNIKTLDGSKVLKMRGVSFEKEGKKGSGVIAQELEKVAPELVNNDNEYKGVAYGNLTGYLIEAIKELEARVKELENK